MCCLQTEHLDCSSNIRFTSHSCSPNCHVIFRRRQVRVFVARACDTHTTGACNLLWQTEPLEMERKEDPYLSLLIRCLLARTRCALQCGSPEVVLVASQPIAANQELSFDYATTEWEMERSAADRAPPPHALPCSPQPVPRSSLLSIQVHLD